MKSKKPIDIKKLKRQMLFWIVITALTFACINYLVFAQDTIALPQRYESQLPIVWAASWFLPVFEYWLISTYVKIRKAEKDGKL